VPSALCACCVLGWRLRRGVQGNNAGKFEQYQLAEIKHCRLAMIAFSGFVHQGFITKQGVFEQLGNFKPIPGFPEATFY